jgi:hypothetical protein
LTALKRERNDDSEEQSEREEEEFVGELPDDVETHTKAYRPRKLDFTPTSTANVDDDEESFARKVFSETAAKPAKRSAVAALSDTDSWAAPSPTSSIHSTPNRRQPQQPQQQPQTPRTPASASSTSSTPKSSTTRRSAGSGSGKRRRFDEREVDEMFSRMGAFWEKVENVENKVIT